MSCFKNFAFESDGEKQIFKFFKPTCFAKNAVFRFYEKLYIFRQNPIMKKFAEKVRIFFEKRLNFSKTFKISKKFAS